MNTSEEPVLLDDSPLTTLVTIVFEGVTYTYRQTIPQHVVFPQRDFILDVADNRVYTVKGAAYMIENGIAVLKRIKVIQEDGETEKYFNLNQVRLLHDINLPDPALN